MGLRRETAFMEPPVGLSGGPGGTPGAGGGGGGGAPRVGAGGANFGTDLGARAQGPYEARGLGDGLGRHAWRLGLRRRLGVGRQRLGDGAQGQHGLGCREGLRLPETNQSRVGQVVLRLNPLATSK